VQLFRLNVSKLSTVQLAWSALATTVLLNLQGAVVRATGSGAGCGEHWPKCNGEIVPLAPSVETLLEFSHRLLSLTVLVLVVWLLVRAFRARREKPGLWYAVLGALACVVVQSLVGAFTVLMSLTGDNTSMLRGVILPIHLINSFSALGALVLAVLYARPQTPGRFDLRRYGSVGVLVVTGLAGMYLLIFTGGIAALGDTIFPSESLREGLAADFHPESPLLLRLRTFHPLIGITVGVYLFLSLGLIYKLRSTPAVRAVSQRLLVVYIVQMTVGTVNFAMLAPIALQLIHLSVAMLAFAVFVVMAAYALGEQSVPSLSMTPESLPASAAFAKGVR
jgi:heme A synthase